MSLIHEYVSLISPMTNYSFLRHFDKDITRERRKVLHQKRLLIQNVTDVGRLKMEVRKEGIRNNKGGQVNNDTV